MTATPVPAAYQGKVHRNTSDHTFDAFWFSERAMTVATGIVFARKYIADAAAVQITTFPITVPSNPTWWNTRNDAATALTRLLTLKSTFTGSGRLLPPRHWARPAAMATSEASNKLSFATANSRNGRLTDMVLVSPGNFTFSFEVRTVTASRLSIGSRLCDCHRRPPEMTGTRLTAVTAPTNIFAELGNERVMWFL